ncbi:hypothetical protein SERLA73DRAFT_181092 [Serpula lacrymans var. lacrymans S7.3]|uniref:DUF6593 domain-containing protein n=2 Tax=Serpula lacrymans var. lacrymans TaxID=341189 RepID=F8PUS2_SERL3|nr:uncharacterized protein SERLADRAFT_448918 [Serpula lacrymans var. lacrymans S7.9]EGO00480.1 hypothetical protein SERLA73DRAFT_181092 [Serpula lacrymans var. lacrymans S7.3]EGO26031.1 hypothetical protein SERLADRAFT_448918 [Serpula lacrymans var. lacrymans S7.9]
MPPPKKPDPPHRIQFATNSLRNTTLAVDNDKFYYEIVTRFWHPHLTKINKFDYEARVVTCVAEIEALPKKEVKVRFNTDESEGPWTKASEFIKCDGSNVGGTFVAGDGIEYRWKTHKRYLQLVKSDDEDKVPIAEYHPYRRHFFIFRMSQYAWLEVKPEATAALEKIIVSYLLVERRRRQAKIRVKLEHQ